MELCAMRGAKAMKQRNGVSKMFKFYVYHSEVMVSSVVAATIESAWLIANRRFNAVTNVNKAY